MNGPGTLHMRRARAMAAVFCGMHERLVGSPVSGRWIVSAGLGATGSAQPEGAALAGASLLVVESSRARIDTLLATGRLNECHGDLEGALDRIRHAQSRGTTVSIGLPGNAAELLPKLVARGERPDMVTDRTPAGSPLSGYLPAGWSESRWRRTRESEPETLLRAASDSIASQVRAMLVYHNLGVPTFELGNGIRQAAHAAGVEAALSLPAVEPGWQQIP